MSIENMLFERACLKFLHHVEHSFLSGMMQDLAGSVATSPSYGPPDYMSQARVVLSILVAMGFFDADKFLPMN